MNAKRIHLTVHTIRQSLALFFQRRLKDASIRRKLIFSYLVAVFIPVFLIGVMLVQGMREIVLHQTIKEADNHVMSMMRQMEEIFRIFTDVSNKLYIDKEMEGIATTLYHSPAEVRRAFLGFKAFDDYMSIYREIRSIRFYSSNPTLLNNWQFMQITDEVEELSWYQNALSRRGAISWQYSYNETKNENYLSLSRQVRTMEQSVTGVLLMEVSKDFLFSKLRYQPNLTMVIEESGHIVAASDWQLFDQKFESLEFDVSLEGLSEHILDVTYGGVASKMLVKRFIPGKSSNGFWIVSISPTNVIYREANQRGALALGLVILNLAFALMMVLYFSNAMSKRIHCLTHEIHQVASGDLGMNMTVDGQDEIGAIADDINMMIESFNTLLHEVFEVSTQKNDLMLKQKDIKMRMLANQINPHFLFNALETIRMKAHSNGQDELAHKVRLLGKIMRYNLEVGSEEIPLCNEMDLVRNYLEIQRFRFGEKIAYFIEIEPLLEYYPILPLTIQPIIENAVIHGLESTSSHGQIILRVWQTEVVHIMIADNGVGMSEERLQCLLASLSVQDDDSGHHIGLKNVHQRLQLAHGTEYGLRISSAPQQGTNVEIVLPRRAVTNVQSADCG